MKLLFDQNLSRHLPALLGDILPGSSHLGTFGMAAADDAAVWEFAKHRGFTIVTKDDDFHRRAQLYGYPPRVVMLKLGNCATADVEGAIRRSLRQITKLHEDPAASLLLISTAATFLLLKHETGMDEP